MFTLGLFCFLNSQYLHHFYSAQEELERELAEFRTNKLDASTEEILGDGFVTSVVHQNVVKALRKGGGDVYNICFSSICFLFRQM